MRNVVRTHLIGWIWLVTAFDIWCSQWLTAENELNPICRIIMVQAGVWGMVAAKVIGTWIATEWLRYLPLYFSVVVSVIMLALVLVLTGVIPIC